MSKEEAIIKTILKTFGWCLAGIACVLKQWEKGTTIDDAIRNCGSKGNTKPT